MQHTINVADLSDYWFKSTIASQFGEGVNKKLEVVANISDKTFTYIVTIDKKEAMKTEDKSKAVKCYNEGRIYND